MVPFASLRVTLIHSGAFHLDQQPGAPVPRVPQISYDSAPPEVREAHDDHIRQHARITNMKRTLLNSLPAFHALMEWYPLRDTVQPVPGPAAHRALRPRDLGGNRLSHLLARSSAGS